MAGSVVWVDVLPSGQKYGPAIQKIAVQGATSAGNSAGAALDAGIARGASRGGGAGKFFGGIAKTGLKATGILVGGVTAIGGAIAGVAAKKGLDRLLDIDDAQKKLKGLGKTQAQITSIMDSALASVKGTAFGLGDAATVASGAVAAGVAPGKELTKYLKLTADAASIAGVSLGEMGSIINKTTSSGKVYSDNLNQLADRGIPIFQWLQKEYGVSADDLTKMVKKGQVDSATFRKVIEQNIGGAALASGESVRGAWANTGAALGRIGAMFMKGGVAAAPKLLTSVTGAFDRLGVALTPVAGAVSGLVERGFTALAGWIDRLDFSKVMIGLGGIYNLVVKGDFTGQLTNAFGVQEDSKFVDFVLTARDAVVGLFDSIKSGNVDGLGSGLAGVYEAGKPLAPLLWGVVKGVGGIAGAAGDVIASGLPLLVPILQSFSDILGWLGDHTEILTPLILGLAAGFVAYKAAQTAANASSAAGLPLTALRIAADIARTVALERNTKAMIVNKGIEGESALTRVLATGSINLATVSTNRNTSAIGRQTLAQRLSTGATFLGAGAMRVMGGAVRFAMGPLGIIIGIVGLLVAGLVWFFTKTKLGQSIVTTAFAAIKVAATAVGGAFVWLWNNAIKPAWDGIAAGATWLWGTVLRPAFDGIVTAVKAVGGWFVMLWTTYIAPPLAAIGRAVSYLYSSYIDPIFQLIGAIIMKVVVPVFMFLWTGVIRPVFGWIGGLISTWWSTTVKPVFGFVVSLIRDVLAPTFSWLYTKTVKPVFDGIGTAVRTVWNSWLKPVFDKIIDVAKVAIPAAFTVMKDGIGKAWDLVKTVVKAPIRFVIETVINDGIIGNFNKAADFFGTKKMPKVSLPKGFAEGGYTGKGAKYEPAGIVHKDEYVLTKEETSRLGVGRIRAFAEGRLPGYASGGLVGAATGAWDWISGKAGKAWDWTKDAAGTAASVVSDPAGTLGKLVNGIIGKIPGAGGMLDAAKGMGGKILGGVIDKLKGLGNDAGVFGGNGRNGNIPSSALAKANGFAPGPGVGATGGLLRRAAAAAWNAASTASGGILRLTEGYRDLAAQNYRWGLFKKGGNLAAAPGTSKHGLGDAADVAGGQSWLRSNGARYGWSNTGLGFSQREPWHFEFKGAPSGGSSGKNIPTYDSGGYLPTGLSLVANNTGRPEPVLTGDQFDALRKGGNDRPPVHFHNEGRDFTVEDYMEAEHRMEVLRG